MWFWIGIAVGMVFGACWCLLIARPKYWYDKGFEDGADFKKKLKDHIDGQKEMIISDYKGILEKEMMDDDDE